MSQPPRDAPPPFIVHLDDVAEEEGAYPSPFDGEKLTIFRDLGRAAGSRTIGFGHERLLPGRRSGFTHAHSDEEELVFVLRGTCHVRLVESGGPAGPDPASAAEPREIPLRAGHVVSFPAGTGIAHTFVNRGAEECVLFVVGERKPGVDRVRYPEDREYEAHLASKRPDRFWST